jgi:hypothetical protein
MMGNVTVDIYQENRTHHRELTGGKYFPGTVDDMTMYVNEFELVYMFKDGSTRPSIDHGNPYGSHIGYPVFSVLNGIKGDKFWLYENIDLVGVTKSHTRLNDRGTGSYSGGAAFKAGSCSIINDGTEVITANTEFKVCFYDKVHDADKFSELFEARRKLEGGRVRVKGVLEPYRKNDDIAMMLRYYHPHRDIGSASRPSGHKRNGFGSSAKGSQFTVEAIMEKIIKGSSGTMLMGFLLGSFINDRPGQIQSSAATTRSNFKRYLANESEGALKTLIDALYAQGPGASSGLGEFIAGMMFPQTAGDMLLDRDETAPPRSALKAAVRAQADANYLYPAMKELQTWERKWVVGIAQQTCHPNGVMDIIVRR